MKALDRIALLLLIIGGINWLLVGLFEYDLVASLFGGQTALLSKIVYVLVGLSALWCFRYFSYHPAEDVDAVATRADKLNNDDKK